MIVFADCDFDKTVMGAVTSMRFTRQGQSCTAASRIYVERPIFQKFVDAVAAKVDAMVMGDPLDEKTDIGTIISDEQFAKVKAFIDEGLATPGATGRAASTMPTDPALAKGLFIRPYIFTDLPNESRLVQEEEIFGPVTVVFPFDDAEKVLADANGTEYGLAASLWTNNLTVGLDSRPPPRGRAGPDQPEPRRPGQPFLWRRQEQRSRQGSQPGIHARALHAQEDHHG